MVINDGKNYFFAKVLKVEWWEYIFSKDQKLKSFHFLVFSVLPVFPLFCYVSSSRDFLALYCNPTDFPSLMQKHCIRYALESSSFIYPKDPKNG